MRFLAPCREFSHEDVGLRGSSFSMISFALGGPWCLTFASERLGLFSM